MICDINDFVGFMGAIYFTITADNLLFKRFWTPNLYAIIEQSLNRFNFALSTPLKQELMSVVKANSQITDSESRYRGGFLLCLCVYLLAYLSITPSGDEASSHLLALAVTFTISVLIYIIGVFFWKRWKWVSISIAVIPLIYTISFIIIQKTQIAYIWQVFFTVNAIAIYNSIKCFIILFLVFPVIIRLVTNWLQSHIYTEYLVASLSSEYLKYKQTEEGLITKDSGKCAQEYDAAFKSVFLSDNPSSADQVTTEFKKVLVERLKAIIHTKSIWFLIKYACTKDKVSANKTQVQNNQSVYILPDMAIDNSKYAAYCIEYAKLNGVRISSFCKEKNIDEESFKEFRKKWLMLGHK